MAIDKFLLCGNPASNGREFILCTEQPKCLIAVISADDRIEDELLIPGLDFNYNDESYRLVIVDEYSPNNDYWDAILVEAWAWYYKYLSWEDGNIDTEEGAKLN